jgi:hypothetical protein
MELEKAETYAEEQLEALSNFINGSGDIVMSSALFANRLANAYLDGSIATLKTYLAERKP